MSLGRAGVITASRRVALTVGSENAIPRGWYGAEPINFYGSIGAVEKADLLVTNGDVR